MGDVDAEHQRRMRAERVRDFLLELWGDGPPPGPDPVLMSLVDAIGLDDALGHRDQLVTQDDGMSYALVAELVRRAETGEGAAGLALPPRLVARMATAQREEQPCNLLTPLPGENTGAWEYDPASGTVGWDAVCSSNLGHGAVPARVPLAVALNDVHPEDRPRVQRSLDRSVTTGVPYSERYRTLVPGGGHRLVVAQGRVVASVQDTPRLTGYMLLETSAAVA